MQRGSPLLTSFRRVSPSGVQIDVQFRARPARAGLAHHPEIVLLVAVDDVNCRVEPGLAKFSRPEIPGLLVEFARIALGRG